MARLSSDSVSLSNFIDETLPPHNNNLQMKELDSSAERVKIPAIDDGSKKMEFEKNNLVFAKLSGHSDPPWPARVVNISWNNGTHCGYEVFFYGTYQVGKVLANKVWRYNEDSIAKFSKPKIASLRKRNDFFRGLVEIRDCPDIAPSPDVPESASKIPKILIRRTAKEDHLKLQAQSQTNDVNTESLSTYRKRKKVKEGEIGMNWESSSVMTGIEKAGGKHKPSSWILEKSDKMPTQDTFTFEDEDFDERSCISESSNNTAGRPRRTTQPPYWRRLEAKTNEMAAKQISGMRRASIPEPATRKRENEKGVKSVKSRAKYRKTTPAVSSKIRGTGIADGNEVKMNGQKSDEKEIKNTSVVCPPFHKTTTKGSSQLEDDVDETDYGLDIKIVVELYPKEDDSGGDADGLKSVGSSANILAAPSSSPAEPEGAKSVSGSATPLPSTATASASLASTPLPSTASASMASTPLPSTASASMASTPHKSGPVTPMSTPGMSAEDLSSHVKNEASCEDISIVKEEQLSDDPREWTVAQTLTSIIRMDPTIDPEDLQPIREQHIDGSALIQLTFHDIVTYYKIKVGPAIKVSKIIKTLQASTQNPEKL